MHEGKKIHARKRVLKVKSKYVKPVCIGCQRNDQVVRHNRSTFGVIGQIAKQWGCKRCGLDWGFVGNKKGIRGTG